jgi:hypothetical protein
MAEAGGQAALPPAHYKKRQSLREPPKNKANVWPHVHELTAEYHKAHPEVAVKDRKTHMCMHLMKLSCSKKKCGGIIWYNSVAARHL